MKQNRLYILYDGRAALYVHDALVLYTSNSLDDVLARRDDYPDSVVYSYDASGTRLADERLEVTLDGKRLHN